MKGAILVAAALYSSICLANPVPDSSTRKRSADYISSCGSTWMARDDVSSNYGKVPRRGYISAVSAFCQQANGQSVPIGGYLSMATRVFLDGGESAASNGVTGFVYFEIHNKQKSSTHVVNVNDCITFLQKLSNDNSKCWGKDHSDTKGGTWQVGSDAVSYHALGNELPPSQDAVDKLFSNGALSSLTLGGNGGRVLSPFPLYVTNGITPFACHSHNDYDQNVPLYDALIAGCVSVEADVWLHGTNLRVSHTDPGDTGATIQDLYLGPLKAILDAQSTKAIFPTKPGQSLTLLVDFKSSGDSTWDAVVSALQPLRSAGYLSHWDGSTFIQGPITVVASGNAPLAKAASNLANPSHDVFMDSRIDQSLDGYDRSNTYYASADFESAITSSGSAPLSSSNLQKLTSQVSAAHAKGFLVRYWDLPSTSLWQELVDEGVDRLNVDDLYAVAGVDWP